MAKAKGPTEEPNSDWPRGFEEHRQAQILRQAFETTPLERIRFVEDGLRFLKKAGVCSGSTGNNEP